MQNHKFYNCKIELVDGSSHLIDANWLHNNDLDQWKGWQCNAGYNRLHIEADLSVYSGACMNDYLGKLNEEWSLLPGPTTCTKDRCTGATDDLLINKFKL